MDSIRASNSSGATRLVWKIENKQDSADVFIDDIIGSPFMGVTGADFAQELRSLSGVKQINLFINSPGGAVRDGLQMYNALLEHPANVTAFIQSEASSAASFVAMAANRVVIAKTAKMHLHDAMGGIEIDAIANAAKIGELITELTTLAGLLSEESVNIASIYDAKAGGGTDKWRAIMQANNGIGTAYRGQGAVDAGLADEVMATPARNLEPMRAVAQVEDPKPDTPTPLDELTLALIPPLAASAGYKAPVPDLAGLLEKHPLKVGG